MRTVRRGFALASVAVASTLLLGSCAATAEETAAPDEPADLSQLQDDFYEATDPSASPAAANERTDSFVSTISSAGGVFLPGFYDNGWDGNAVAPIFASLVVTDDAGEPIGDLAEDWEVSEDGLTYTFHLREGLVFSDGSPLTADDVAFTLTLLNDPSYEGSVDFTKVVIAGTDDYKNGDADAISGISVIDDQTIEITTEKVNPNALTLLGGQVLPEEHYGADYVKGDLDYLRDLYSKPIGAGPYAFEEYVEGQEIRYTANENYYDGEPAIGTLIFKILSSDSTLQNFQNGDIDQGGFGSDPDTLEELQGLGFASVRARVIPDLGQIWVNNDNETLADTEMRQALYYGLDRQQIVDAKYKGLGQVADVYAAPTQWSYTNEGVTQYPYDPEKAEELLDGLGWEVGSDGIREKDGEKLTISYITTTQDDPVIPVASATYSEIGIDFVPEVLDGNTAFARFYDHDYDLAGFRTNGLVDPDDAVNEFASEDPHINVTGYENADVTKLVDEGISTFDQDERQEIYAELYQALSEDPPTILLDYRKSLSGWNARIQGGENFTTGGGDSSLALAKLSIADD